MACQRQGSLLVLPKRDGGAIKNYTAHPEKTPPEGLEEKIAHLASIDPHAEDH